VKQLEEIFSAIKQLVAGPETAEVSFGDQVVSFAEGVEAEVEVARSGKFVDMNRNTVEVTPDLMKALASSFDPATHEPKLKLGHEPIKTDTPDFGSVTGLSYDETRDRLLAKIRPTMALVRRVREGAFNQRSMEFALSPKGDAKFLHLGFLGARKPAISGLAPVALSEPVEPGVIVLSTDPDEEPEAGVFLFGISAKQRAAIADEDFAGPGKSFPIDTQAHLEAAAHLIGKAADPEAVKEKAIAIAKRKGFTLPAAWAAEESGVDKPGDREMSQALDENANKIKDEGNEGETSSMATEAKIERMKTQLAEASRDRVKAFLAANNERLPMQIQKIATPDALVAMLAAEIELDEPKTIKFSEGGEEKSFSASEFVFAILAAYPPQVTPVEQTEIAAKGAEETVVDLTKFAGASEESVAYHLAVVAEVEQAKAGGAEITYLEGVRRVESKNRAQAAK